MMTATRVATRIDGPISELDYLTDEALVVELKNTLAITVASVAKAARILAEMTRRGMDLSSFQLSRGLMMYLPLVAERKLLPEVVVEFMGDPHRLRLFSSISLSEQKTIVESGKVPVWDERRQGVKIVPLAQLDADQADLAIDPKAGRIRTPEQQRTHINVTAARNKAEEKSSAPQMMHLVCERDVGELILMAAKRSGKTVSTYLKMGLAEHIKFDLSQQQLNKKP